MFRILLVDDEHFFRQGLREIINWEACGYHVIGEQDNGEDALAFIIAEQPDVVITDIRMPEVDGLELIHKVIYEEKLSTKFIIVSGYDEFKYAQKAVKYGVCDFLLKPIDEQILEETLRQLHEKLLKEKKLTAHSLTHLNIELLNYIVNPFAEAEQVEAIYKQLNLDSREQYYFVLVEYNHYPYIRANDIFNQMTPELFHMQLKSIFPKLQMTHLFPMRGKMGVLLADQWLEEHTSFDQLMKQLHYHLKKYSDIHVHLYYSGSNTGANFLRDAVAAAELAFQYKYVDDRQLFSIEQLSAKPLHRIMLPNDAYRQLLYLMENNDQSQITFEIDLLFQQFTEQVCSQEAVKATMHKLVADCLQIIQTMQIDKQQLNYLNSMLNWSHYNIDLISLKKLITTFILECAALITKERKDMARGGIQRIKKYIDQNFAENISLKSIAAQFYINPVYLGQLFKKTYDVYFNEYLLQTRIHEAKKLLRQTDMKIYEISSKVGFNHAEYFVAQFEKTEKLTPTAYRQTFQSMVGE